MKTLLIPLAITLSLSACASNMASAPSSSPEIVDGEAQTVLANNTEVSNNTEITLEKIMSDPDWIARSPKDWYWGDDSKTIYYKQKRVGSPVYDLFSTAATTQTASERVKLAQLHVKADTSSQLNNAGTHAVYIYEGNVFLKELATQATLQLTYTSAIEKTPVFLVNGNVAYRVKNKFFEHDLATSRVRELASLVMSADNTESQSTRSYIAKEQHVLIDYVALQQRNKALKNEQKERIKSRNSTITQTEFYLGAGNRVVHASLSPRGDKMIVSVASSKSSRSQTDIMPNYISDDGNIHAKRVRARVADNRKYQESLFLLDLKSGQKFPLSYQQLPGFDEDVLADVRKENYAREGKSYQVKNTPRNIHVMRARNPIQWREDGQQVAILLEAWDNKDRWLTSVNLFENKLVSQHRLHDDAWVNNRFNEFGWLGNTNHLFYLSEESGYSQLYTKSLVGKAKKVTSGEYEISDVILSKDASQFFFKANMKHPGIYEVYSVNVDGEQFTALTDLDGMVDFKLSPDESTLLLEYSSLTMPPELYVQRAQAGQTPTRLTFTVSDEFLAMPWTAPNVVPVPSSHQELPVYSRVYLPKEHKKDGEKYRAVMFNHGAGYLQNSHLGWSGYFREFMFHNMLAQQGYVVIDMDYRASKGYGRDWRTAIYRHMGEPEVQDMLDGVQWLVNEANVDENRIGTYGGSYGGFLTLMALFKEPEVFQSGSALRLVSDWAYYNHGYTSNILNTPEDDKIAYERSSPIYFAEGLNKPLLINAPMVDDNVFFQDTVRLVQRLIELEKQNFETAIYPVEPHGFVQPSSWLDEYRRIYKLFETNL
ncbi:S9 family peptidase [Thalassotalea atypica]|uniref:S9 family peptidase n=1 Tax=Thalassotalea atypica TaxID=2054316 RepID=UPI0025738F10|nr:prolyl oligopeptidase family serine peptidase [Thalassotalea atypica]